MEPESPEIEVPEDTPYTDAVAVSAGRKVKLLLTGMAVSDEELAQLKRDGSVGMRELVHVWTTDPAYAPKFRDKMLAFFRNAFQQIGFRATEDFKMQLLQNGGFDFGGASTRSLTAYAGLVQNIQDSFALTAWELVNEGRPLIETLTTQRYRMTTALKSLYLQIEAPDDRLFKSDDPEVLYFYVDYSGNEIPLEQTLDESSANYLVFDDRALPETTDTNTSATSTREICRGGTGKDADGNVVKSGKFKGHGRLFQRLLGFIPRYTQDNKTLCYDHSAQPYFTEQDLSDWQWVNTRPLRDGETQPRAYDLPLLRTLTELPLALPRSGFYTTPAFLALWNTNDSNQHRVTANQTLLVAFGSSFTADNTITPFSTEGLDAEHSVSSGECYGCHKLLDPLRAFWGNQYDYNDRNDFPIKAVGTTAADPRPSTLGGVLAYFDVNMHGDTLLDLGGLLANANRTTQDDPVNAFAWAFAQKLCFYANSTACAAKDREFLRVVRKFQSSDYDFRVLVETLFSSPLVTGAVPTTSFVEADVPVSISRRAHFCGALSGRLGVSDVCALAVPIRTNAQTVTARLAGGLPDDSFSRGSENPITPRDPSLFHRAAVEMLCENLAKQIVDAKEGSLYTSDAVDVALEDFAVKLMNYPKGHPQHEAVRQVLADHYQAARADKPNAGSALRSAFVLACESPTSVGVGL